MVIEGGKNMGLKPEWLLAPLSSSKLLNYSFKKEESTSFFRPPENATADNC